MAEAAYTRLTVDEHRRQVLAAGSRLFTEHAFEEITMRQIAEAAGISKGLLYQANPHCDEASPARSARGEAGEPAGWGRWLASHAACYGPASRDKVRGRLR